MIGYYGYGASFIGIIDFEYGFNEKVLWTCNGKVHKTRIYFGSRDYFLVDGRRIHLDECLRCRL